MYSNSKYNVTINIYLENGIYVFDEDSATGKTRLCNELKELQKLGEPVIGYTYNDDKLGIDLKTLSVLDKSISLLTEYPCVPEGSKAETCKSILESKFWNIHRQLVDDYNNFVESYKTAEPFVTNKYKKIAYIK